MSIILETNTVVVTYGIPKKEWSIRRLYNYKDMLLREIKNLDNYRTTFKCDILDKTKIAESVFALYKTIQATEDRIKELEEEE